MKVNFFIIKNLDDIISYFKQYCDILDCVIMIDKTTSKIKFPINNF